jgi:dienelactone hydrolase
MRALSMLVMLFLLALPPRISAEEPLVVEETSLSVVIKGKPYRLEALVAKEAGTGRLPVAILTHGQAAESEKRERVQAHRFLRLARDFARRGWLAVAVVRRGFGRDSGPTPYVLRHCRNGDFATALDDQTDDLEAAIKSLAQRSDADTSTVLALGVSMGGAAVLNLASRQPEGLKAVVNLSGGIRSVPKPGGPPTSCTAEDLIPLFARFGERSRLPTLWLYAENDSFFPADYVRRLHETFLTNGGRAQFHMFAPVGEDGHFLAEKPEGLLLWLPALDRFLRQNKLKTYDPAPLLSAMEALNLPAPARQVIYRYEGRATEKALAISKSNKLAQARFGGNDLSEVEAKALAECEEKAKEPCRLLLRNFELVPEAR